MRQQAKKRTKSFISIAVTMVLALSLLPAQALADDPPTVPLAEITTGQAECIGSDSVAIMFSEYDADSVGSVSEFGIEIATEDDFSDAVRHVGTGSGKLFLISGLAPETAYYYHSYMLDEDENEYYGEDESFSTPAEAAVGTTRDSRKTILTEIAYINALLAPYGVNAGDLASLPVKEEGFYEELAQYANISVQDGALDFSSMPTESATSNATSSSSSYSGSTVDPAEALDEAALFGKRFEYSYYIAGVNILRDPDASELDDEVVYMYLSHYIDMIPADVGTTVDYNSNARKYSAWITYYDREVYDSYLNASGAGYAADKMRAAVTGLANLGSSTYELSQVAKSLSKSANTVHTTITAADATLTPQEAEGVGIAIAELTEALSDDKTPEQVIAEVHEGLSGHNYEKEIEDFITSVATSIALDVAFGTLAVTGPVGILIGSAIFAVNLCSMAYLDMYQYVAWLAMGQSLSGRVPGRMLRYYGLW
jgi:hypothetical protein